MIKTFKDQLDREVSVKQPVKKIISLVPSISEYLFDLGLNECVAGITKFCCLPENLSKPKVKIGGTKNINTNLIQSLQPDLIIANKEENVKEDIELLAKSFPVWISDVNDLTSALQMMQTLGEITQTELEAEGMISAIESSFSNYIPVPTYKVIYLIWKDPYMVVGGDTFINFMLKKSGFINLFDSFIRYPVITSDDLQKLNPDLILLSSEPYPFSQKHLEEFQQLCPLANVLLVDGRMYSWYGSRLKYAVNYFQSLRASIHK